MEKKAVEDKLAKALAAGAAPGASAPHALSPKAAGAGGNGKDKDKPPARQPPIVRSRGSGWDALMLAEYRDPHGL
jgi:hypothetical protein